MSLNPKKCFFSILKGNLLGHIVSKEGIYNDLEKFNAINDLNIPTSRKGIQYFFWKNNFVWKFVLDYSIIFKPINKLSKKDKKFAWTPHIQKAFT